ncbi:MAG: Mu-like prophage major head subunit gpT family protein [Tepidibacter sp.]|jgi:phage major head subunit gpT-like protein|uniref:Mu-like prophage major head subunit gpT family protein n=1 Tax=Tepidibacter sp. TaxID=2529387 RepID=UPI0025F59BCE|nr:Mu-like prophage major head subunit gpT family protein [Tepidibacter sp.]MCT4509909.1 Mu-like prophage major head subunit gpT family protein [Tepidibacter sp.]
MLINRHNLQDLFNNFNTIFNKTFEKTEIMYPKIAMEIPSSTSDETYSWLGSLPSMREWVGDRVIQNLSAYTYSIKNKDFELTVGVDRNDIEDDKIGIYKPMIQDLAESARKHPDKLVFGLLSKSFQEKCYDGQPLISENHPTSIGARNIKQSNKGKKKLTTKSYGEARVQMMSIKGSDGESLKLVPDLLVVSPQNESIARQIVMSEMINSTTNIYKGTAEVLVVPELIDTPDAWFLFCTKKAIKPFIFQNRKPPKLVARDGERDDNVFFEKRYIYGVDSRCNAGYGLWQLVFGSTGEIDE